MKKNRTDGDWCSNESTVKGEACTHLSHSNLKGQKNHSDLRTGVNVFRVGSGDDVIEVRLTVVRVRDKALVWHLWRAVAVMSRLRGVRVQMALTSAHLSHER